MNRKIKDWSNLNVWIIGASSGIGNALSLKLLEKGANLYVSSRKEELLNKIKSHSPEKVMVLPLDVLKLEDMKKQFALIPNLDVVIYLAADYSPLSITNFDAAIVSNIIDVNLKGATNMASIVLPNFIQRRTGHLSIVASIAGFVGLPASSAYGATKAAIINMCESFYNEAKDFNVDISVINPGFVKTNLTAKNDFEMPFIMTPEEAADAILKGFSKGKFAITFPTIFSLFFRFARILPYSLQLKFIKKMTKV
jgi:short-subunit dehydrogenase